MTCVVGVIGKNEIFLGADSSGNSDNLVMPMTEVKIFKKGPFAVGYSGSLRVAQIIRYKMRTPTINQDKLKKDPMKYLSISFVNAMRKALKQDGASREISSQEENENDFIVAYNNRLFHIDGHYSVCESARDSMAIGSGMEYALGSLHTTRNSNPEDRVKWALDAANEFCPWVMPPYHIIKI